MCGLEQDVDAGVAHGGRRLARNPPRPEQREVVEAQPRRGRVGPCARSRRDPDPALGALGAEIGFRRGLLRGGEDRAAAGHATEPAMPGLGEQRAYRQLGVAIAALTEVGVAHVAAGVDQVLGGPVLVAVRVPGAVAIVLGDGIAQPVRADRRRDVARVMLERELGRVDADDRQPVPAVLRVQSGQEGQGAHAVDARVGPEVHEHDAPAQRGQRQWPVARRVEPALCAGEVRRGAEVGQWRGPLGGGRPGGPGGVRRAGIEPRVAAQVGESSADRARALQAGRRRHVGQVSRQRLLEAHVHHREHQRGGHHHHSAERALQARAAARPAHAVGQSAPARGQRKQHRPRSHAVGQRDEHELQRGSTRGADRDHRGQDRPGAGGVHEAERGADDRARPEPAARRARAEAGQARQRRLEPRSERRHDQRDAEPEQYQDRQRAQEAARQADAVHDRGDAHHRQRERRDQPDDHAQRTAPAARGARGEQRRQHGQDARGDRRAGAGEQSERHQDDHTGFRPA